MPTPTLQFIGKEKAAPELIVRWCRQQWPETLPPGLIFCVPTALAFRRLRDALTFAYGAFHGVRFIQPSGLVNFFAAPSRQSVASPSELLCLWDEVFDWLQTIDADHLVAKHLFPGEREWLQRPRARYAIAQKFIRLRATLVEQQLDFGAVARHPATATLGQHEQDRWKALDALETYFRERLRHHQLEDPLDRQLATLRQPAAQPQETGDNWHLIVACVPDIMPALTQLFAEAPQCTILVQADPAEAADFDDNGLPLPSAWEAKEIPLPDEALHIAETPNDEAVALDRFLRSFGTLRPSQLCLGLLDHAIIPAFSSILVEHGVSVFAPEPIALAERSPARAIQALLRLYAQPELVNILPLFAHERITAATTSDYATLRAAYHTLLGSHRPRTILEALTYLKEDSGDEGALALRTFLLQCQEWLNAIRQDLLGGLRAVLLQLYGDVEVHPTQAPLHFATFDALRELLNELETLRLGPHHPPTEALLLTRLNEIVLRPVRQGADCSYEGRLEILWSSAPILLMAGLNEGLYPDTTFEDLFLPNHFRRELGLRSDANRVARDAYILSLAAAQRAPENLCLLCARTNAQGDWVKPSRLFFRCNTEQRRRRAAKFFLEAPPPPDVVGAESALAFAENPVAWAPKGARPTTLSPSAIKAFLQSKLEYWLGCHLGLGDPGEPEEGIDATAFGTLVHNVLAKVPKFTADQPETLAAQLIAELHAQILRQYGSDPDVEVVAMRYDAEARLRAFARLELAQRAAGWQTVAVESAWLAPLTVDGSPLQFKGKIDRIDRNTETGALRIIDYKTSKKGLPPNETHYTRNKNDGTITWADFQLPIYRLLVRHNQPEPGTSIELGYMTLPAENEAQFHRYTDPVDENATFADLLTVLTQLLSLGDAPLPADVGPYGNPLLLDLMTAP